MSELDVRNLLEKYWEGESSLADEEALRNYFTSNEVADEFIQFQPLFGFFGQARMVKMEAEIQQLPQPNRPSAKVLNLSWMRVAAAAVILAVGLFFVNRQLSSSRVDTLVYNDTYQDPEVAYEEFRKAMHYVSGKMNRGVNTAARGINKIETLTDILN